MIPEATVEYDDNTPYHLVPMYRTLLRWHLALITRVLVLNKLDIDNSHNNDSKLTKLEDITGSFIKEDIINTTNSNKYKGFKFENTSNKKTIQFDRVIKFPVENNDIYFEHSLFSSNQCLIYGCENPKIRLLFANKTLFIVLDIGARITDIKILSQTGLVDGNIIPLLNKEGFHDLFKFINTLIKEKNITQIVLSGHSYGFILSSVIGFCLLCITNSNYLTTNERIVDTWKSDIDKWSDEFKNLNIPLFIVGSGGFPILFQDINEFKNFYDSLYGRYVHVVSGALFDKNSIYLDKYSRPINSLQLYKFGVYIGRPNIAEYTNSSKKISKYKGEVFFYKIFINNSNNSNNSLLFFTEDICRNNTAPKPFHTCIDYTSIIHQFYFYKYILSIFIYGQVDTTTSKKIMIEKQKQKSKSWWGGRKYKIKNTIKNTKHKIQNTKHKTQRHKTYKTQKYFNSLI